uniref:Signal peptide peptidase SppA n=1 Tax=Prevotella sp. GTC17260 TaxID=3236796 RepID=A0AB33J6M8_9BACT
MKDFLKNVFATIVGLFIFGIITLFFCFIGVIGMMTANSSTKSIEPNSVLLLKLDGNMPEHDETTLSDQLYGNTNVSFKTYMEAINEATHNGNISCIYLESGNLNADIAQRQELRDALLEFKKSGKKVIAYGEDYSLLNYYMATAADKIYMNPIGSITWKGIGGEMVYVKDLLSKVGVRVVPFRMGKYKSAVEMFTEDKMSESNREQTERYIHGWWDTVLNAVSGSRKISKDSLNAYADRLIGMEEPSKMVGYKMVDGLCYNDQIKDIVKKAIGVDKDDELNLVTPAELVEQKTVSSESRIAIYYAYGDIVNDKIPQSMFAENHQIIAKDVCRDLQDLAKDEDIEAVVIRINSGGGDAYASEQLWHQITELRKKKPVVISMSGAAASGGYYMSCPANWIVADPTTLTGSIGIFGLLPDQSELMTKKLGLKFDEVKTNRNAVFGASGHFLTEEQFNIMQTTIENGYRLFKKRVAEGRKMSMEQVENIAQGHVYLGADAVKVGLVDELGGLNKAVAKAAELAKLKNYSTESYPAAKSWLDNLMSVSDNSSFLDSRLEATFGEYYTTFKLINDMKHRDKLQAAMPYILRIQ